MFSPLRALTASVLVLSMSAGLAPFQCASRADPKRAPEEEPGEALYGLAEQFHEKGDQQARIETLRYIVQKYPSSRFSTMARQDLETLAPSESTGTTAR